jgi:hypothetical protein
MISSLDGFAGFIRRFSIDARGGLSGDARGRENPAAPVGLWFVPPCSASHTFDSGFRQLRKGLSDRRQGRIHRGGQEQVVDTYH